MRENWWNVSCKWMDLLLELRIMVKAERKEKHVNIA